MGIEKTTGRIPSRLLELPAAAARFDRYRVLQPRAASSSARHEISGRSYIDARRKINLSLVFAGQNVGIKEVAEKIWQVTFMDYDSGFFDQETGRVECAENPFAAKVLPMSPV